MIDRNEETVPVEEIRINNECRQHLGMSLHDFFAGMATMGLLANEALIHHDAKMIAALALEQADANIEARKEAKQ